MSGRTSVRFAAVSDAERIAAVINSAFRPAEASFIDGDRIDVESVVNFLGAGKFLLAESEGLVVGCVYVEPENSIGNEGKPARCYLGLLSVAPQCQQSGVGTVLMEAAEAYCRGLGCRFMDIKIVNLRAELPAFYRKRGYRETGTSPFPADAQTKLPCYFIDMTKNLEGNE